MEELKSRLEHYLVKKTSWVFVVLLLFMSYLLTVSVVHSTWYNFLSIFVKLCIVFSPILLFSVYRDFKQSNKSQTAGRVLWILAFIVAPLFVYINKVALIQFVILPPQLNTNGFDIQGEFALGFLLTLISALLFTELGIFVQRRVLNTLKHESISRKISIDQMVFIAFMFLAFLLSIKGLVNKYEQLSEHESIKIISYAGKFLIYFFQYALISSSYYFFYYVNKSYLIPKIMRKSGTIQYFFSVAGVILIFSPIFTSLIRLLPMVTELDIGNYTNNNFIFGSDSGAGAFIIIIMSLPIIISNEWFYQNSQISNLEKEKSNAELTLLKNQINPHFFFNTLNNLYALSITKDKQTPEVILQLSELMRYVIYRGKEELVPLKDEIKYIEDYIQLQKIRLHNTLDYQFDKSVDNPNIMVPPLLFITFVENSFKHGIESAETSSLLYIELRSTEDQLYFSCTNSFEPCEDFDSGIGLDNFKRRMELRYPNQHQIEIKETEHTFKASLQLIL